jgi:hypothetical protein
LAGTKGDDEEEGEEPGKEVAVAGVKGEVGAGFKGACEGGFGDEREAGCDTARWVNDLGDSGGGGDGDPTAVFGGADLEESGVLLVLAGGPGDGVHGGSDDEGGTGGGHFADDVLEVAVEADGGADGSEGS